MAIFDPIGGEAAVTAAVDEFYQRVLDDAALAPFFDDTRLPRLKAHQRAFITAAPGGPTGYERCSMAEAHAGRGIADVHFDAVVGRLADTPASLGVPTETVGEIASALAPLRREITA